MGSGPGCELSGPTKINKEILILIQTNFIRKNLQINIVRILKMHRIERKILGIRH